MDRRKAEVGRVRDDLRRRKKIKEEKESEKEDAGARKGRSRISVFFQCFVAPERSHLGR